MPFTAWRVCPLLPTAVCLLRVTPAPGTGTTHCRALETPAAPSPTLPGPWDLGARSAPGTGPRERWSPAKVATPVSPSSRMSLQNSRLVNPTAPGLLESTSDFWLQKIIPRPTQAKIWEGLRPSSLPPSPPARLVASAFQKGPEASAGPLATPARSPGTLLHSTWRHLSSSETGLLHSP